MQVNFEGTMDFDYEPVRPTIEPTMSKTAAGTRPRGQYVGSKVVEILEGDCSPSQAENYSASKINGSKVNGNNEPRPPSFSREGSLNRQTATRFRENEVVSN